MRKRNFHISTTVMNDRETVFSVTVNKDSRRVEFRGPNYQSWTGDQSNWAERLHDSMEGWHSCVLHADGDLTILPNHPDHAAVSRVFDLAQS